MRHSPGPGATRWRDILIPGPNVVAGPGAFQRRAIGPSVASSAAAGPDAVTTDWVARVVAAGSTVSAGTQTAVDTFIKGVKADGCWTQIYRINVMAGATRTAARVPLKVGAGANALDTHNVFVDANYTEGTGLLCAATRFIQTGATPAMAGIDSTTGHLFAYNGTTGADSNGYMIGCTDAVTTVKLNLNSGPNIEGATSATGGQAGRTATTGGRKGSFMVNVIGSALNVYARGLQMICLDGTTTGDSANSGATPNVEIYVGARNNNGTADTFSAHRLCGYSFGTGFTKAQAYAFHKRWQTLQVALGRAYVEVATPITCCGDSLTHGRYPVNLRTNYLTRYIRDLGLSSQNSAAINARFQADPGYAEGIWILPWGRNDSQTAIQAAVLVAEIKAAILAIETAQGVGPGLAKIIVCSPTNGRAIAVENNAGANYHFFTTDTRDVYSSDPLISPYFVDMRQAWIDAYNSGDATDISDHSLDVPPNSLMTDTIHPNAAGITVWANTLIARITAKAW
jgi:hypothetical protein